VARQAAHAGGGSIAPPVAQRPGILNQRRRTPRRLKESSTVTDEAGSAYCLILDRSAGRVLLLPDGDAWTLPRHEAEKVADINRAMRRQLGLDTVVLRYVYDPATVTEDTMQRVAALESRGGAAPAGARWVSSEEAVRLPLVVPEQRALILAYLAEQQAPPPALREPWAVPGWLPAVEARVAEQLGRLGYTGAGPLQQAQLSHSSCVYRAPTTRGLLYFKAVTPVFGFEPALTTALGRWNPAHAPQALAADPDRCWLLLADAGALLRDLTYADHDLTRWEPMLRQYAAFQQAQIPRAAELLALGCPDRRLARLPDLFDTLAVDREILWVGRPDGVPAEEYAGLGEFRARLERLCAELADFGLPETLYHEDFNPGNITVRDGEFVFIDWAECGVGHPFYSLMMILRWARILLKADEPALLRLRDAYFDPWLDYAAHDRLVAAFALAGRVGKLTRALTWRAVTRSVEPAARWEDQGAVAHWLLMLLRDTD
jgi:hypothetical protein